MAYEVKTENGGSYIGGVPALRWGAWRDNTYCGCIAAVTEILGAPVSYETLMGVSGICYRLGLKTSLDPSSGMPQNGQIWDDRINAAIGYKMYALRDERRRNQRVRENLDAGRPVLCVGAMCEPEWELLTGYDGHCFFGRSYFDTQGTPQDRPEELRTPHAYLRASNYPGWVPKSLTRFFDKPCKKEEPLRLLQKSLEACLMYFTHEPRGDARFGEAAYRILIDGLEAGDGDWGQYSGNVISRLRDLADARRSAYVYLRDCAPLLRGSNRAKLRGVAEACRSIADDVLALVPYAHMSPAWSSGNDSAKDWDSEFRQTLADALGRALDTEKTVQLAVKGILAHWGETK